MSDKNPAISADTPSRYQRGNRPRPSPGGGGGVGRSLALNFVLAVLIAGLALAGWFVANQQQSLDAGQKSMEDAEARLAELENRLRVTDATMTEAGADTTKQIGFWETEIRKLWDVSNKRNKNWIEANQATLKKQNQTLASIDSTLRTLKASVSQHDGAFKQQQDIIDQLAGLELRMTQVIDQQRDLIDKANLASQTAASLKASLESRVRENEQAITAIDTYRLQVNGRLADFQRRLEGAGL